MSSHEDNDMDDLLNNADELLKYLGHLNKLEHISTVTELMRKAVAAEAVLESKREDDSRNKQPSEDRPSRSLRDRLGMDGVMPASAGVYDDPSRMNGKVVQLPANARKLSIEL